MLVHIACADYAEYTSHISDSDNSGYMHYTNYLLTPALQKKLLKDLHCGAVTLQGILHRRDDPWETWPAGSYTLWCKEPSLSKDSCKVCDPRHGSQHQHRLATPRHM